MKTTSKAAECNDGGVVVGTCRSSGILSTERNHLQILDVGRDGDDAHGVRVAESTFPTLDGDDGRTRADDAELETLAETEADAVVDLFWFVDV